MSANEQVARFLAQRNAAAGAAATAGSAAKKFPTAAEQVARYLQQRSSGATTTGASAAPATAAAVSSAPASAPAGSISISVPTPSKGDAEAVRILAGFLTSRLGATLVDKPVAEVSATAGDVAVEGLAGALMLAAEKLSLGGHGDAATKSMILGRFATALPAAAASQRQIVEFFAGLNASLASNTYMAGNTLTVADLYLFAKCYSLTTERLVMLERYDLPYYMRWYDHMQQLPGLNPPKTVWTCLNALPRSQTH
eukprot:m.12675 g.12675  ORF g.12675 m.12675 type:complete len:254 (-) comp3254_c0_seq1:93-854(-)